MKAKRKPGQEDPDLYYDETWVPDDNEVGKMARNGWMIEATNDGFIKGDAEEIAARMWENYSEFKDNEKKDTPLVGHQEFTEAKSALKSIVLDTFQEISAMEPDDEAEIFADLTREVLRAAGVVTVFDEIEKQEKGNK